MSDKLITRSTGIVPADDFAKRVEEELGKRGEEPVQRVVGEQCFAELKAWAGIIQKCVLGREHAGQHHNGSGVFWANYCPRTSRYGTPCRYQKGHEGSHADGADFVWFDKPFVVDGEGEEIRAEEILGLLASSVKIDSKSEFAKALEAKLKKRAAGLAQRVSAPITKARSYQLSFGPVVIPAGKTTTIGQTVQMYFRGEKLMNTGDIDGLIIENIVVGQRMQMPNAAITGGMSAAAFTNPIGELYMDTATSGQSIVIIVRNAATDERRFSAVLFGKAVA